MSDMTIEYPIKSFDTQADWRQWLEQNYDAEAGVWLRFYKKDSGIVKLNYDQALEEALCFGWIDGQVKKYDDKSWLQKFTPRRLKSMWSKRNKEKVARLIELGKMHESGLAEVEAAKADGRWDKAYDSPKNMEVPKDFLEELAKDPIAEAFFKTLTKVNTYAIAWRLQTAKKPETRERRKKALLEMLHNHQKLH
jgi:uncharacterized protein YdeI (YjbR/CyaY-like superfamily)